MKYLITESQYTILKEELMIQQGVMDFSPINDMINVLTLELGGDIIKSDMQDYLSSAVGLSEDEITKLVGGTYNIHKLKKKIDLICGLLYFIAKKHNNLIKVGNLSYLPSVKNSWFRGYFDEGLETYIGFMSVFKKSFKGLDCYKVSGIQVINQAKSRGYGKEMYLSLFNDAEVIQSDDQLFTDSLNIWVNVLPKYAYVWLWSQYEKPKRIKLNGELPIFEDYEFFLASKTKLF